MPKEFMKTNRIKNIFIGLTAVAAVVSIIGVDVAARVAIQLQTLREAIYESIYYSGIQAIGTAVLLGPFLVVGSIVAAAAGKGRTRTAWSLFVCGIIPLMTLYCWGHVSASQAMMNKAWTAAALSIGLLPFWSVPVLCGGLGLGWLIGKFMEEKGQA